MNKTLPIYMWAIKSPQGLVDVYSMSESEGLCLANAHQWLVCNGRFGNAYARLIQRWGVAGRKWRWTAKRKAELWEEAQRLGWKIVKLKVREA